MERSSSSKANSCSDGQRRARTYVCYVCMHAYLFRSPCFYVFDDLNDMLCRAWPTNSTFVIVRIIIIIINIITCSLHRVHENETYRAAHVCPSVSLSVCPQTGVSIQNWPWLFLFRGGQLSNHGKQGNQSNHNHDYNDKEDKDFSLGYVK